MGLGLSGLQIWIGASRLATRAHAGRRRAVRPWSVRAVGFSAAFGCAVLACGSKQEEARPSYLPDNVPGPGAPGGTAASSFLEEGTSRSAPVGEGTDVGQQLLANRPMLLPEVPAGVVTGCFGEQCPAGACEADPAGRELLCTAAYPMAVTNVSSLCPFRDEASFCMNLEDGVGDWLWAISCAGGQASFELCTLADGSALCEAMAGEAASCIGD